MTVIIITGGGSGIGRATALRFARDGANILIADINRAGGEATVAAVAEAGGEAEFRLTDVADFGQVEAAVERAVERFGGLDVMFNNAGIGHGAPLLDHDPADYDRVVKVNQYGVYHGILAAGRKMRDLGTAGVIINVASVYGYLAAPNVVGYQASKAAVRMMTQTAALELAPLNIRVVGIAPGFTDTAIIDRARISGDIRRLARLQMRGKVQTAEEIADVVHFLASDAARAINGSIVMTDDGYAEFK